MKKEKSKEKTYDLVFGIHPIIELLKAKKRKLITIYTTKPYPKAWDQIAPLLSKETQLQCVSRDVLTRLAQTTDHQSVVAWATPLVIRKKFFEPAKSPFLLLLDGVQDPRNVGAILRSAYCTGVDGVILCGKNSAPLNATVYKSSAGLAEHMDIYMATTALAALQDIRKAGYLVYLATLDGDNATEVTYKLPSCLVIGNEATGISKSLYQYGMRVCLPQRTTDISYNASVAAGILLFLMAHQSGKI